MRNLCSNSPGFIGQNHAQVFLSTSVNKFLGGKVVWCRLNTISIFKIMVRLFTLFSWSCGFG